MPHWSDITGQVNLAAATLQNLPEMWGNKLFGGNADANLAGSQPISAVAIRLHHFQFQELGQGVMRPVRILLKAFPAIGPPGDFHPGDKLARKIFQILQDVAFIRAKFRIVIFHGLILIINLAMESGLPVVVQSLTGVIYALLGHWRHCFWLTAFYFAPPGVIFFWTFRYKRRLMVSPFRHENSKPLSKPWLRLAKGFAGSAGLFLRGAIAGAGAAAREGGFAVAMSAGV